MPIIAIAAAVFAAVEIVEVGLAAMTVFEAVAAVGAVTSGVGVVTGNEDLQKVGQVMAIAGGVGTIATKLGVIDASTPIIGDMTVKAPQELGYAAAGQTNPADTAAAAAGTAQIECGPAGQRFCRHAQSHDYWQVRATPPIGAAAIAAAA